MVARAAQAMAVGCMGLADRDARRRTGFERVEVIDALRVQLQQAFGEMKSYGSSVA